jgi:hypothetical protein
VVQIGVGSEGESMLFKGVVVPEVLSGFLERFPSYQDWEGVKLLPLRDDQSRMEQSYCLEISGCRCWESKKVELNIVSVGKCRSLAIALFRVSISRLHVLALSYLQYFKPSIDARYTDPLTGLNITNIIAYIYSVLEIMVRKSARLSSGSTKSTPRKRIIDSSESEFDDGRSSGSDFETTKKHNSNKRRKIDSLSSDEVVDNEESDDEARPPKVTIIPLPKAREAGDIPYEDGRIHKNTLLFLKDLKANNNREWMRCNVPLFYLESRHMF